jgi:hypothetical protein
VCLKQYLLAYSGFPQSRFLIAFMFRVLCLSCFIIVNFVDVQQSRVDSNADADDEGNVTWVSGGY